MLAYELTTAVCAARVKQMQQQYAAGTQLAILSPNLVRVATYVMYDAIYDGNPP